MRIHFIGVGGIGVSALAKYYLQKGHRVSGSDLGATEITEQLKEMGAEIHTGKPNPKLIESDIERIVFSPAVPKDHPERAEARKKGIAEFSYPQALGELSRQHFTIAVSGTHGKSTTTAMLGLLLAKAKLDPTVIVGTKLKEFGNSNCRVGKSKYLVIEADEYADSFLNYRPDIAVLTSLEADHLDYFKTFQNMLRSFQRYVELVTPEGVIVANGEDENIRGLLRGTKKKVVWYAREQKGAEKLRTVLSLPGEHNVSNALAALSVARLLKVPDAVSFKALSQYKGSWRRFETFQLKKPKPYTLVSDYGHHPTEIKVTVEAARQKWPGKELWLVYQPHQYQRTFNLFQDFVRVLSRIPADRLILIDIYDVAGREEGSVSNKVSSSKLAEAIKRKKPGFEVLCLPKAREAEAYLMRNLRGGEVVMVMGAGNIYQNLTLRLTRSL